MIVVLSPAKSLDFESAYPAVAPTERQFQAESLSLIKTLKKLDAADLSELMTISPALAELNVKRFADFQKAANAANTRPALFAFNGDVYDGLDAYSLKAKALKNAEKQIRILSGLYGVLKPFDAIKAYRLEMGTALETSQGKGLYSFWGEAITQALNDSLAQSKAQALVNCASQEYFKAVKPKLLNAAVIDCVFEDEKNGNYKTISFFAKKARGLMARFIVENGLKKPEDLNGFDTNGYVFNKALSTDTKRVFRRQEKHAL